MTEMRYTVEIKVIHSDGSEKVMHHYDQRFDENAFSVFDYEEKNGIQRFVVTVIPLDERDHG